MRQPRIQTCPLCAEYVEIESSAYDEVNYRWGCDHGRLNLEPVPMTVNQFMDPQRREVCRKISCLLEWQRQEEGCQARRRAADERDYATLRHSLDLTYTPADRRARHRFRHLSSMARYSAILKHTWLPRIQEHLDQHRTFAAAFDRELMDTHIGLHAAMRRQAFGTEG